MGENAAPPAPAGNGEVPGQPFYDKTRQHLKELLHKKRLLERNLSLQEDTIFRKETEYLEETPSGNIITGFEAYTKATGAAGGAARRRGGVSEGSRVFSRSSVSFNPAAVSSGYPAHDLSGRADVNYSTGEPNGICAVYTSRSDGSDALIYELRERRGGV